MTRTQSTRPDTTTPDPSDGDARTSDPTPGEPIQPAAETPEQGELSLDHVFDSLKNSRRRQVLAYLQRTGDPATVSELAEYVAAIENDTTVQALSSQQRKRVYVGLYQCHLPKLDDKDIVEYDDDRGTVALGPTASQLTTYLEVAQDDERDDDRPWHTYYLGIAGLGLLGVTIAGLGVAGPITTVAPMVGVLVALALVAVAVLHGRASN